MGETIAQHTSLAWALLAALGVLVVLALVLVRARKRRREAPLGLIDPQSPGLAEPEEDSAIDVAALTTALQEAEKSGEPERLPALYLSLAQRRLEVGERAEAEDLLRKCIRAASAGRHKAVHAKARLVLGDVAHAEGDLTTACEHWQIARAIFHELKRNRDHAAAEERMLRNGCPTDWVLTDF